MAVLRLGPLRLLLLLALRRGVGQLDEPAVVDQRAVDVDADGLAAAHLDGRRALGARVAQAPLSSVWSSKQKVVASVYSLSPPLTTVTMGAGFSQAVSARSAPAADAVASRRRRAFMRCSGEVGPLAHDGAGRLRACQVCDAG